MTQVGDWRSYEATAMWWSFAVAGLLLVRSPFVQVGGLICLVVACSRRWQDVRRKPVLMALLAFSLAVTGVFEYAGKDFVAATVALTGWLAAGHYSSGIMFMAMALLSERKELRYGVTFLLAVGAAFGVEDWISRWPRASENPYLAVSLWRPLWTVAVPLFWIAALLLEGRQAQRRVPLARAGAA